MKAWELEGKITQILERNARVETDKAWETSLARRLILAVATYIAAACFLLIINAQNPFLAALVPAGAYLLQQYSMPFFKKILAEKFYKK